MSGVTGRRWARVVAMWCAVAGLAACGPDPASPGEADAAAKAGTQFLDAIPADADVNGAWSAVHDWPLIPLHDILLPDGRVLSYGSNPDGNPTAYYVYDVWDPSKGFGPDSHTTYPNNTGTDLFCAAQILLPKRGAGVLITGGDNWTGTSHTNTGNPDANIFDPADDSLTSAPNKMHRGRWYGSQTMMLNGEVYVQGGLNGEDHGEIRRLDGTFDLLEGFDTSTYSWYYPRNYVIGPHRIFGYDTIGRFYVIDTQGDGTFKAKGQYDNAYFGDDSTSAMFRPRRILQFGGNSIGALVIDVRRSTIPTVTTTSNLSSQRRLVTGTILPNGQVLATGGSRVYNELVDVNNHAETWNPVSGSWHLGSEGGLARLYHSIALLMPDGSVLVGGGGGPGPLNNLNMEVYSPPYLFTAGKQRAARPRIESAPANLSAGQVFTLRYTNAASIARVTLVKSGTITHGYNQEQRFVELPFTSAGKTLTVRMPSQPADVPPGNWLLHVLNAQGVPSVAARAWIAVDQAPDTVHAPALGEIADRTSEAGQAVSMNLDATDPDGDPVTFTAAGLPPGTSIHASTGRITGTPERVGSYDVVVNADDGVHTTSANFLWTVGGEEPLTIDPLPPPTPAVSGTTVFYTAHANGTNTRYRWNFGDGTPTTSLSDSGSIAHGFTQPGIYYVTVTAVDDHGIETSRVFLQSVYLPPTAKKPAQSSTIVAQGDRVWVVNQDADTVSAFDSTTGDKLVEIPVGAAPRAAALTGKRLWVVNKRGDSVSVIDTSSFDVVQTVPLPRASQPAGLAIASGGDFAYITLEATGKLLKVQTSDAARVGSVDVGPRPRHVSVSADGTTVHVSRFITPPQPGESTATVQGQVDGAFTGGEVVRVKTGTMSVAGTTVLRHSTKPDAETQGRGVPNYLGAASISPDGTQAYVPSKLDNILRGTLRDGRPLNFQNTVRAVASRIRLGDGTEDAAARLDLDNASLATAAAWDPLGVYLFVALSTSREVAVVDAHGHRELFRVAVGRAPAGLAVSPDGETLFVDNFMDRTVEAIDLRPLRLLGEMRLPRIGTWKAVGDEPLSAQVLLGKQLFYDARDTRLSRDRYLSCATCHDDGDTDGRTWDFTNLGEGLRNTVALRGRGGTDQGFVHWSNNFDEVQDFEQQIRTLGGGRGLMQDEDFFAGTREQPLGRRKAGVSAPLDALAAYVGSLDTFERSPYRAGNATLTPLAASGRTLFTTLGCQRCHAGAAYTGSGANTLVDVGTLKPSSGARSGGPLTGIDVPTLRDAWATAPYLHDGRAATIAAAIRAHDGVSATDAQVGKLVAFVEQLGREEPAATVPAAGGSGLAGRYFANPDLAGAPVLERTEAIDFTWDGAPGPGVPADGFSVRWSGAVVTPATGSYVFRTITNDGVRLAVDGTLAIDEWDATNRTTITSAPINLKANRRVALVMRFREQTGHATARLLWKTPGDATFVPVPADRLLESIE
ncbi:MAG TPA: galactose oxidase-like domain-containing protein [Nevskiaceae bacterium]|nr:galactose oxidase-like domain-containing protein [Nevskiaceae bacterium]